MNIQGIIIFGNIGEVPIASTCSPVGKIHKSRRRECQVLCYGYFDPFRVRRNKSKLLWNAIWWGLSLLRPWRKASIRCAGRSKTYEKNKIGTLFPDIYVSKEIKELIESNNLTGFSFDHEVKDYKGREMSSFLTLDIHHVLPPMRDSVWLIKDEYPDRRYDACGHSVVYLRSDIQYEKEKLDGAQDFNLTNEYVDNFRLRQIIVNARVRKLFKQNKVYSAFFPVAIL